MVKITFSHPYVSSMYVVLFLLNSWLKVHTKKLFSLLVYYVEKYLIFLVTTLNEHLQNCIYFRRSQERS